MDLARAIKKFSTNSVYGWDVARSKWVDTGIFGSLQVYDRFITERSFGQKKRILTTSSESRLPVTYGNFKVGNSASVFIMESVNEDIKFNSPYGLSYLLHSTNNEIEVLEDVVTTRANGDKRVTGESVVSTCWADIERFGDEDGRGFDDLVYTVVSIAMPKATSLKRSMRIRVKGTTELYGISEIFASLDLQMVRGRRISE